MNATEILATHEWLNEKVSLCGGDCTRSLGHHGGCNADSTDNPYRQAWAWKQCPAWHHRSEGFDEAEIAIFKSYDCICDGSGWVLDVTLEKVLEYVRTQDSGEFDFAWALAERIGKPRNAVDSLIMWVQRTEDERLAAALDALMQEAN